MIFRYPGAKNKLLRTLDPFLEHIIAGAKSFHDVFVGGGSVLIHVAKKYPKIRLHANDADDSVASFWKVIADHRVDDLCNRLDIRPTIDLFLEVRSQKPVTDLDKAFQFVFLNRTTYSGLWTSTPIGGKLQQSRYKVFCNWTGNELIKEIQEVHQILQGRLTVTSISGVDYVRAYPKAPRFIDPPYFRSGKGLYRRHMSLAHHLQLAGELRRSRRWVLTFDDCAAVRAMYSWARCQKANMVYHFRQTDQKCATGEELIIVPRNGGLDSKQAR